MCGRSSLFEEPQKLLESHGLSPRLVGYRPRYNIAPSQDQWAILRSGDGKLQSRALRWGFIPSWANDSSAGSRMINARAESIAEKPSFRDALHSGRCLIIADGYYEWARTAGGKTPYRFQMADRRPFVFAGLWGRWEKGQAPIESCTIITTEASSSTAHIHDRMPVILNFDDSVRWMSSNECSDDLLPLLRPYPKDDLQMYAVSRAVNNAANESAGCIQSSDELAPFI